MALDDAVVEIVVYYDKYGIVGSAYPYTLPTTVQFDKALNGA